MLNLIVLKVKTSKVTNSNKRFKNTAWTLPSASNGSMGGASSSLEKGVGVLGGLEGFRDSEGTKNFKDFRGCGGAYFLEAD